MLGDEVRTISLIKYCFPTVNGASRLDLEDPVIRLPQAM